MTYSEWLQTQGDFWSLVLEVKPVKPNHRDRYTTCTDQPLRG